MADRDFFLNLPFSKSVIDRAGQRRTDDQWLAMALKDPSSRVLELCAATKVPVLSNGDLEWLALGDEEQRDLVFLGLDENGAALFSIDIGDEEPIGRKFAAMREVGQSLAELEGAAAIQAIALTSWHRRHQHCASCGAKTLTSEAGHTRHCPSCDADHYPRMDPAVIMLVTDGEHCVLGHRAGAPEGRWSTLAGYVEPGEAPEAAVVREVFEESGLTASEVRYRGSQPWPFPSSLMLAFEARAPHQPLVVSDEHEAVRWFAREELARGLKDKSIGIPPPISAGHHLIMSWLAHR